MLWTAQTEAGLPNGAKMMRIGEGACLSGALGTEDIARHFVEVAIASWGFRDVNVCDAA